MTVSELQTEVSFVHRAVENLAATMVYTQAMVGDYKYSAQRDDAEGWLLCDGRAVPAEDYPFLYRVIGNAFGGTSGASPTFKLPDFRGRTLGAVGTAPGLSSRALGQAVGAELHALSVPEMPSHSHATNAVGGTIGLITATGANTVVNTDSSSTEPNIAAAPVALSMSSTGSGDAHNNMQPTIFAGSMFIFGGPRGPIPSLDV